MTEQEFQRQVWRQYDQITTADGVKGKVIQVAFNTKCVRAYISGSPEWIKCELIETHTTGKGADGDDVAIIEELHNKVLRQADEIAKLREEKQQLADKIGKNYLKDLLAAVNMMKGCMSEKKSKIEKIDRALDLIVLSIAKIDREE